MLAHRDVGAAFFPAAVCVNVWPASNGRRGENFHNYTGPANKKKGGTKERER